MVNVVHKEEVLDYLNIEPAANNSNGLNQLKEKWPMHFGTPSAGGRIYENGTADMWGYANINALDEWVSVSLQLPISSIPHVKVIDPTGAATDDAGDPIFINASFTYNYRQLPGATPHLGFLIGAHNAAGATATPGFVSWSITGVELA